VAVAGSALILLAPLFLILIVLIKLDSSGPAFFRQVRVGRRRRLFGMWKFRKMHDRMPEQGPSITTRSDPRLTRVGRVLERTKLDELPQLFNVLVGDMSIVGPRPEVPKFVAFYPERWDEVLSVRPGIVGPSQFRFRNESHLYPEDCQDVEAYYTQHILPAKLALDADYVARNSLAGDLFDLVRCFLAVVVGCVGRKARQEQGGEPHPRSSSGTPGLVGPLRVTSVPVSSSPLTTRDFVVPS
jgi:lipopolysaccharide/colanic/teichoic acid biosynthesis glycosyltransferase